MGVITKKNKPARSRMHGITWLADPESGKNIIQAEANWQKVFAFWSKKNASGKIILPVHDKSCFDIAKMLLKIGVEIFVASGLASRQSDANMLKSAKEHIIRAESEPWPYFLIRDDFSKLNLVSLFYEAPEVHDYLKTLGFDLFFHSIEDNVILFFSFGDFRAALSITSRTLILREYLNEKGLSAVPCPGVFDRN
jgi:hypothetical protein